MMHKKKLDVEKKGISPGHGFSIGTFASLRLRDFRFLLSSTLLSNAAHWIQHITLNWLVYDLTSSGTMLGTINLVRSLAAFGTTPVAGFLIDRLNRRRLMLITNGWLFVITFGLALLLLFDRSEIWHLFVFALLGGMAQSLDQALRQVAVFDLAPRPMIPNAVALIQTGWSLMRSLGPALGGFLILWFGPGGNFLIQAGAYILISITILQIRFPIQQWEARSSFVDNILVGIRYVAKRPVTRTFVLMGSVLPLFTIPIFVTLLPIYAVEVFADTSGKALGLLMASVGVGGIFGGIATASLGRVDRRGLIQLAALLLLNVPMIGFALCRSLWVALLLLALTGFFEMIFLTTNQTLLQLSIPDDLRGRVTGLVNLNAALFPLGGMIVGVGSDLFGGPMTITIVLASISAGIAVFVFLGSGIVRNYRLSEAICQTRKN